MVSYLWRALKTHHVQPCTRGEHPNTSAVSALRTLEHLVQTQCQMKSKNHKSDRKNLHVGDTSGSPEPLMPPQAWFFSSRDFCVRAWVRACVLVVVPIFVWQFLWEGFPSWLFPGVHGLALWLVSATFMKHLPASVGFPSLNDFKCRWCWMRHKSRLSFKYVTFIDAGQTL